MSRDDWFRNTEWNAEIEARFEAKLSRASRKSQYIRTQAGDLADTHPKVALALIERYLLLEDHFDKAGAFHIQACAYKALGDEQNFIRSLQCTLEHEREFPNVKTLAWRDYVLLIAVRKKEGLYDDALKVLEANPPKGLAFPVERFCWYAAFALISQGLGCNEDAKRAAQNALDWSEAKESGFRYHKNLGLVGGEYDELKTQLHRLLNSEQRDLSLFFNGS